MRFLRRLFSVRISDLVSDRHPCRAEIPVAQTHLTVRDPEMRSLRFLLVTRAGRLTRIGGRHVPRLARGPPPRPLPITALTGLFWATGSINAITARRLAFRRVTRWTTLTKNSPRPKITRAARRWSINAERSSVRLALGKPLHATALDGCRIVFLLTPERDLLETVARVRREEDSSGIVT